MPRAFVWVERAEQTTTTRFVGRYDLELVEADKHYALDNAADGIQ